MGRPMMPRPTKPICMGTLRLDWLADAGTVHRSRARLKRAGEIVVRWWLSLLLFLLWGGVGQAQQAPGPVGTPEGVWREQIHWVPLDIAGTRYLLYTRVCRPPGEAPARVVVIAHGLPP